MKRVFSVFLAGLIGWGSVTQPARAFAPPLIFAAYMTATTGAGTYTIAGLAGVIGIAGMYLTVKDAMDNSVRIPVGPNASNQPPAPAAAASQPTSTKTTYTCGSGGYQRSGTSVEAACAAYFAATKEPQIAQYGQCPNAWISTCESFAGVTGSPGNYKMIVSWTSYCTSTGGCIGGVPYLGVTGSGTSQSYTPTLSSSEQTCPGGYTQSGSSCALTNARQATDDKACDLLYAQGAFATANDMNCGSSVDGSKVAPMIRDGKVIAYGTNSSGQPLMWEVTPGAQTWTVKEIQQIQTATQTQIKTTTATVDAATSAVTSVQTQTSPGSMTAPTASTAPTATTQADPTTATNTPTVTQDQTKPADLQTCGLPGTPACAIDDTQFDGKDNFSSPRNSEINDKLDQNKTQLENSKDSKPDIKADWLPSLMPGNVTACSPLVFDFTLHNRITGTLAAPNVTLDICDKLELVRAILGYMLGLYTVWYVWRRFTTANQGA